MTTTTLLTCGLAVLTLAPLVLAVSAPVLFAMEWLGRR